MILNSTPSVLLLHTHCYEMCLDRAVVERVAYFYRFA